MPGCLIARRQASSSGCAWAEIETPRGARAAWGLSAGIEALASLLLRRDAPHQSLQAFRHFLELLACDDNRQADVTHASLMPIESKDEVWDGAVHEFHCLVRTVHGAEALRVF